MINHEIENEEETISDEALTFITNRWSRNIVQPILITFLITSLFTGVLLISRIFEASSPWISLTVLFVFVSLEGIQSTIWLDHPERHSVDRLAYRAAELLILVLIVRLYTWAISNTWPRLNLLPNYLLSPVDLISDPLFWGGLILTLMVWQSAIGTADIFFGLAIDRAEANYYTTPVSKRKHGSQPFPHDRSQLTTLFFQRWVTGGFILIICTSITTFDLSAFVRGYQLNTINRMHLPAEMVAVLVIYFISGFLLLSQARLAAMNARWLINGIAKNRQIERRWHKISLSLLILIAFISLFLPIGSTLAISSILKLVVKGIVSIFYLIMAAFFAAVSFIIPKGSNFSGQGDSKPPSFATPPTLPPQAGSTELFSMIISSLFWAVMIVMIFLAITFFLRERGYPSVNQLFFKDSWRAILNRLQRLWVRLFAQVMRIPQKFNFRNPVEIKPGIKIPQVPWRFVRVNMMSPREQLRYFYLSIVHRAGKYGVNRHQSETPLEYARELKQKWPEAEEDVDLLTDAFLTARYDNRKIEKEEITPVIQQWKRLKSMLKPGRK